MKKEIFENYIYQILYYYLLGRDERRKKSSKARSEPLAREAVDEEVQRAGNNRNVDKITLPK